MANSNPERASVVDLKRPRVGSWITYRGEKVGKVTRVEGNLCWRSYPDGGSLPFIWRFRDQFGRFTMNALHDWPGKPQGEDCGNGPCDMNCGPQLWGRP